MVNISETDTNEYNLTFSFLSVGNT